MSMLKQLAISTAITLALCWAGPGLARAEGRASQGFKALCYHDVVKSLGREQLPRQTIPILAAELRAHFEWLKNNGWRVVSLDDVIKAQAGGPALPEKAVLLTFDDGYASFYDIVFPLLKEYDYKAVLGLVTGWLEVPDGAMVPYGDSNQLPRSYFLSWAQVKEAVDSGLVEAASHSRDLHRGVSGSPKGVRQPAGVTLAYNDFTHKYETEGEYLKRLEADWRESGETIGKNVGPKPRLAIWPYGLYTKAGVEATLAAGYLMTAALDNGHNEAVFQRLLVTSGMTPEDLLVNYQPRKDPPQRVMHVDLDNIHDDDPDQIERNLAALMERVRAIRPTVVYLQAYADPDGNGAADAMYFPNRRLPVRADLFNRVSWQLLNHEGLPVYAWMPTLAFEVPGPKVQSTEPGKKDSIYQRLTPFDEGNRKLIKEIYEDLAAHANFQGLLFHDDAIMGDFEDVSEPGRKWLEKQGLPLDVEAMRQNPEQMRLFTAAKTKALTDWTLELAETVRAWRPEIKTARNIFAGVALNPAAETWMSQSLDSCMAAYDYTAIMAMPFMEGAENPQSWMAELADAVLKKPQGAEKTVFELQAVDWREAHKGPIPGQVLADQMELLLKKGILNFGYYPENPFTPNPEADMVAPLFEQSRMWPEPDSKGPLVN